MTSRLQVVGVFLAGAAAAAAGFSIYTSTLPTHWRELREMRALYDSSHAVNAGQMRAGAKVVTDASGNVVPAGIAASVDRQVDLSVELDDYEEIQKAKLQHRVPKVAVVVPFWQPGWSPIITFAGPAYLMVAKVWDEPGPYGQAVEKQDLNPRGVYVDGKPEIYKQNIYRTVMEDAYGIASPWVPYLAPLVRHCRKGACAEPQLLESKTLVCDPLIQFQFRHNEWVVQVGQRSSPTSYYFGKNVTHRVWPETTGAAEACAANAGASR